MHSDIKVCVLLSGSLSLGLWVGVTAIMDPTLNHPETSAFHKVRGPDFTLTKLHVAHAVPIYEHFDKVIVGKRLLKIRP